jgi:serine/threonine protein kinase
MRACPSCQSSYPTNYTHCPRDGTPLVESEAWGEGTIVRGKYRILAKVGVGGMATVYKAVHTRFGELRALKVMNAELATDQSFVKRFMHEAVLTRKLQHPNAVRVDDIDEAEDGRPFIVMEYIDGRNLKDVIQTEAPMALERVCSIIIQVASALDVAHGMGIVHRDVKPANIVLAMQSSPSGSWTETEQAKVLDFGIAKAKEASADDSSTSQMTLTGTGRVIGTPAYMSPEQARGKKGDQLDGRSDLYSLGVVMYQMIAGGLPFMADSSMEWILAHLQMPPKPIREARPDLRIPRAIAAIVMQCLEKDPQLRPHSANALIDDLRRAREEILSPLPTSAFEPSIAATRSAPFAATEGTQYNRPLLHSAAPLRAAAHVETESAPTTSVSRRSWAWAGGVIISVLLGAVAILLWRINHQAPPSLTSSAPRTGVQARSGSSEPRAPSAWSNTPTSPSAGGHAVSDAAGTSAAGNSATSNAPTKPEVSTRPTNVEPGTSLAVSPAIGAEPTTSSQLAQRLRRERVADAVGRAQEQEKLGNFEEALKEYERASKLDPSDARLRDNIHRIQGLIKKEKELMQ